LYSRTLLSGLTPAKLSGSTGATCLKITIAQMLLEDKITMLTKGAGSPYDLGNNKKKL
jgi:hypothetical protein